MHVLKRASSNFQQRKAAGKYFALQMMRKEGANFLRWVVFLCYFSLILSKKLKFTSKRDLFISSDID